MLVVAFLFAASINYDKIAMLNSDPVFGMAFTLLIVSTAFTFSTFFSGTTTSDNPARDSTTPDYNKGTAPPRAFSPSQYLIPAFLIGLFAAVECVSINIAYTLQIAPYVIAIKRLSIIFMVLYGTLLCAEGELRARFAGAVMMVGGAVIILLFT
jgi:hypothetical protein